MLEDPEEDVAKAAHEALRMRRDAREAELLSDALETEQEPGRRWVLLDALLDLGDPGSNDHPLPDWVVRALRGRPFLERDYIREKLEKRRKSIKKEADRQAARLGAALAGMQLGVGDPLHELVEPHLVGMLAAQSGEIGVAGAPPGIRPPKCLTT